MDVVPVSVTGPTFGQIYYLPRKWYRSLQVGPGMSLAACSTYRILAGELSKNQQLTHVVIVNICVGIQQSQCNVS